MTLTQTAKAAVLATLLCASPLAAHQATVDEHAELIPIPAYAPPAQGAGSAAALTAIKALMDTMDGPLRFVISNDFGSDNRANWSNLPVRLVPRAGFSVGDMTDEQRDLLFQFLSAALGKEGYGYVADAMTAEAFLQGRPRATFLKWAPENYFFTLYGNPSNEGDWGWQFGGHHLAVNLSYNNGELTSISPTFIGSEPAKYQFRGAEVTTGGIAMHKEGYALYSSLDDQQRAKATLKAVPNDIVTGPGRDGLVPPSAGISASALNAEQQTQLMAIIRQWVAVQPDSDAEAKVTAAEGAMDQLSFAWVGTGEVNTPAYMRIQGPDLIIELMSFESHEGETAVGHYHSIIRDPNVEYGVEDRN